MCKLQSVFPGSELHNSYVNDTCDGHQNFDGNCFTTFGVVAIIRLLSTISGVLSIEFKRNFIRSHVND